jgi:hypothetical protein
MVWKSCQLSSKNKSIPWNKAGKYIIERNVYLNPIQEEIMERGWLSTASRRIRP